MSQITVRPDLKPTVFPLLSIDQGRTVLIRDGSNTAPQRQNLGPDADEMEVTAPQAYYMHNVLPTSSGFQSISYEDVIAGSAGNNFQMCFTVKDAAGRRSLIAHNGFNFYYYDVALGWRIAANAVPSNTVTYATAQGYTYIFVAGVGCYRFDAINKVMIAVTFTGLDSTKIRGIVAFQGYLIAWGDASISWSTTLDWSANPSVIDFVPSLITGAGGGDVEGAKGRITFCSALTTGIICYTTENAVSASYSGNARFPFSFREIQGAGGISSGDYAVSEASGGAQYAYTTAGIQLISVQNAQLVFPAASDFLGSSLFEDFDETTRTFTYVKLTTVMKKKVQLIASRYLVLSYGVNELTHAIIYDIALKRWGKLKITHTACFEFSIAEPEVTETPKRVFGFLQSTGAIKLVNFSRAKAGNGVLLLGKYQYTRQRLLQLQEVIVESIDDDFQFELLDLYTTDGKNNLVGTITPMPSTDQVRSYKCHNVGINHSLMLLGAFSLVSMVMSFNLHGRR